ncbi:hypothetical protein [Pedobacter psychrodurus]|jgi:hypothetical protein|uniref:hypothetical protein n=1 Tax=Pedobacter psychrodurus TaxID=2530456 RepID=UPI00292E3CFA|nr:hypothetical protein [Pedobacter psychrodurus]
MEKLLLSENVKRFIDYAIDTVKAMDGAPEHSEQQKAVVTDRISKLKLYLNEVEVAYLENAPERSSLTIDPEYIAETGHS